MEWRIFLILTRLSNVLYIYALSLGHKPQHREDQKASIETCSAIENREDYGIPKRNSGKQSP